MGYPPPSVYHSGGLESALVEMTKDSQPYLPGRARAQGLDTFKMFEGRLGGTGRRPARAHLVTGRRRKEEIGSGNKKLMMDANQGVGKSLEAISTHTERTRPNLGPLVDGRRPTSPDDSSGTDRIPASEVSPIRDSYRENICLTGVMFKTFLQGAGAIECCSDRTSWPARGRRQRKKPWP